MRAEGWQILFKVPGEGNTLGDKPRPAQLVGAETGLSQADAEKRIDDVRAQAKAAAERSNKRLTPPARRAIGCLLFPLPPDERLRNRRSRLPFADTNGTNKIEG